MSSAIRLSNKYCHAYAIPVHKQDKGFVPQICVTNPIEQLSSAEFYALFKPFLKHYRPFNFVVQLVPQFL